MQPAPGGEGKIHDLFSCMQILATIHASQGSYYSDLKSFWYFTKWILHNTSASKQRMYELRTTCGRHVLLVSSRASVKVNYLDSLKLYDQQNSYSLHKVDFIPKLYRHTELYNKKVPHQQYQHTSDSFLNYDILIIGIIITMIISWFHSFVLQGVSKKTDHA